MSERISQSVQPVIDRDGRLYDEAKAEYDAYRRAGKRKQNAIFATYKPNMRASKHDKAIDSKGGLYDRAVAENAVWEVAKAQKDAQDAVFASYQDNVDVTAQREQSERFAQDSAYRTYRENIQTTQRREQDEAYATYEDNITATREREAIEYREARKKLRSLKNRRNLGRVATVINMLPGIGFVSDVIAENVTSARIYSGRSHAYREKNGTLFGNSAKGYASTLGQEFKKREKTYNDPYDHKIIEDLETLIAERDSRKDSLSEKH